MTGQYITRKCSIFSFLIFDFDIVLVTEWKSLSCVYHERCIRHAKGMSANVLIGKLEGKILWLFSR
jgi:hypothetical protein